MPKINQKEYEILKSLDDKWEWIARNNLYGGHLEAHTTEPQRMYDSHWSNGDMTCKIMGEDWLFKFIQWENEPYNIQDLIWEYEFKELTEFILELEKETFEKLAESEETEVKDIEWLKKELEKAIRSWEGSTIGWGWSDYLVEDALKLVNQLEVETLSLEEEDNTQEKWQEFTEFLVHEQVFGYEGKDYLIIEKPVIPRFIADYLPLVKEDIKLEKASYYAVTNNELPKWEREYDWIRDNFETFVKAWLAYPNVEIEEEQKYYVVLPNKHNNYDGKLYLTKNGENPSRKKYWFSSEENLEESLVPRKWCQFTEQEIRDHDERYMAFAVPVEELEE